MLKNEILNRIDQQIKFVGMVALNRTVSQLAVFRFPNLVQEVFDRPTPFIMKSFKFNKADKDNLTAEVFVDASDYLGPVSPAMVLASEVFGGQRKLKRFEVALQSKGLLPLGQYVVPGRDARRDQYGNMSNGQIVQVLSALQAFTQSGHLMNKHLKNQKQTQGSRPNKNTDNIFVVNTTGRKSAAFLNRESLSGLSNVLPGLPMGVYQRVGKYGLKQLMKFIKQPTYSKRFPFFEEGERLAAQIFNNEFNNYFNQYLNK